MLTFSEHKQKYDYAQKNQKTNHEILLKISRHRFSDTVNPFLMSEFCGNQERMLIFSEHKQKYDYAQKNKKKIVKKSY